MQKVQREVRVARIASVTLKASPLSSSYLTTKSYHQKALKVFDLTSLIQAGKYYLPD
tara:strand:- start:636 stop:806 length:171 start_codon:yes stop_codon:yes gene_type:complete